MQAIGCGHIAKLFLQWTSPWWAPGEGGITLAWNSAEMKARILPRDWFLYISAFSEVEAQPNLLVCWVAGSGARVVDQLEDEEVREMLLRRTQKSLDGKRLASVGCVPNIFKSLNGPFKVHFLCGWMGKAPKCTFFVGMDLSFYPRFI